jgi:hypothetical protein
VKKVGGDRRTTTPAGHVAVHRRTPAKTQLLLLLVPGFGRDGLAVGGHCGCFGLTGGGGLLSYGATPLRPTCGWVSRPCRRAWGTCFPDGDTCMQHPGVRRTLPLSMLKCRLQVFDNIHMESSPPSNLDATYTCFSE